MSKKLLILFLICILSGIINCTAQTAKIKVYFNHPVDTSLSSGVHAIFLNQTIDDTIVAYINRAKYSIDIAVYNYSQSGNIANISGAINNAFANGIKIRWIYNESSSNSGLTNVNNGIHKLASPAGTEYGIMHNKFMVIDAASENLNDPIVLTGSCNWNEGQFYYDVNNVIIFQDSELAKAYTNEFNEMWGDTGLIPDAIHSKFGPYKSDNTQHLFNIGGIVVEQYFSPSDGTNSQINDAINSADEDLYFGVYTFTGSDLANSIVDRIQNHNVQAVGIIDEFSQGYAPYDILSPVMNNNLEVYTLSGSIYHNKMLIADPCTPGSDPLVETGSHNWTFSAETKNDENTVIIHSDTIANIYYQSFYQNFVDLRGRLAFCKNIVGVKETEDLDFQIYPNPSNEMLNIISSDLPVTSFYIYNTLGKIIYSENNLFKNKIINTSTFQSGIYLIRFDINSVSFSKYLIG